MKPDLAFVQRQAMRDVARNVAGWLERQGETNAAALLRARADASDAREAELVELDERVEAAKAAKADLDAFLAPETTTGMSQAKLTAGIRSRQKALDRVYGVRAEFAAAFDRDELHEW